MQTSIPALFILCALVGEVLGATRSCKLLPSDSAWPSPSAWKAFNGTVSGRLVKTVPLGSPCYEPNLDPAKCQFVKDNWTNGDLYLANSAELHDTTANNKSCDPFIAAPGLRCGLGILPEYAVNVSSTADIVKTIKFARKNNIRFVVKNTGHDWLTRSAGTGGLSIWTHHLQSQEWSTNYKDPWSDYRGPAVKAYAGVMGKRLSIEANKRGYVIVVGDCPTVGWAGGYATGGGHSHLAGWKGLGADQILSFEVITTTGQFLNASTTVNPDLFWALRGGGGGTYAIVWSVTIKAYKDVPFAVGDLRFSIAANSPSVFWKGQEAYHRSTPVYADAHAWTLALYTNTTFIVPAILLPDSSTQDLAVLTQPLINKLNDLGVVFNFTMASYPGYEAFLTGLGLQITPPANTVRFGGRILPRKLWESEEGFQKFMRAVKAIVATGVGMADTSFRTPTPGVGGAVLPAWRTMERFYRPQLTHSATDTAEKLQRDEDIMHAADDILKTLSNSAYLNEAEPHLPEWKEAFYGSNYDRLLKIKDRYDPDQLLYGATFVGGDRWAEREGRRLCPV